MIVVTGGLGFIGNELVRQLKAAGEKVAILDNENRVAPAIEDLKDVPRYTIDITDGAAVDALFGTLRPRCVYHLAAIHYIPECNAYPERTIRVNVEGTLSVLNAAIKNQCERFLFASTGAVYADSPLPLSEKDEIAPVDIYGWSKWFAEELCRSKKEDIQLTICRLFNNIGLRETNAHIIPEIISQLKTGTRTLQLGNTTTIRDYISTEDTAQALIQLGKRRHDGPEVYNIATGTGASVDELIQLMSALLNEEINITTDTARFRKADKQVQLADVTKLKHTLGWEPQYALKEVVHQLMKFEGLIH
jgi:UDP-glucose 4-epimerase